MKDPLWMRWTLANALSEMLGLGLTFVITGLFFASQGEQNSIATILLAFAVAVLSGALVGAVPGCFLVRPAGKTMKSQFPPDLT